MEKSEARIFTYRLFFVCFSVAIGILLFSIGIPFLIGLLHKESGDYLTESSGNEEVVGLTSFEVSISEAILKIGEIFVPDVVCKPNNVGYLMNVISDYSGKYSIIDNEIVAQNVGECCVFVSVTDAADNTLYKQIDLQIIEDVTQMDTIISANDINSFTANIRFDKSPVIENLSINFTNENDFVITSQLSEVETNVYEFNFKLNNLMKADMEFVYNNESSLSQNTLLHTVEIVQDIRYFEFCFGDFDSADFYNLYIFNNDYVEIANGDGYIESASIGIIKGFDIENAEYSLEILGTSIIADGSIINAESEGTSSCNIGFMGEIIASFQVIVSQIDVEEIIVENNYYNLQVGDTVSIVPTGIMPIYAIYQVQYGTESSAFAVNNGMLTANSATTNGKVCIYAGNCAVEIIVNIEDIAVSAHQMILYDMDGDEIETTYVKSFAQDGPYEVRLQYQFVDEIVEFEIEIVDNDSMVVTEEGWIVFYFNQKSNFVVKFIEEGNNSIMKEITVIIT